MSDNNFKLLEEKIRTFENSIRNINKGDDPYNLKIQINQLENSLNKIAEYYRQLEEEINDEDSSITKPLINKLNTIKKDIEKNEKILKKKKIEYKKLTQTMELFSGRLSGADLYEAENNVLLDQHKNIDNQGVIIESIGEHIKGAVNNLGNINSELNEQREQIDRIDNKVLESEAITKQTNTEINKMTKSQKCTKYLYVIAIIVFGIFDLIWIGFSLYHKFK